MKSSVFGRALNGMQRFALLGAALLLATNTVCAASFDCAKAGTKVEKMICADPELSKLDEDLSAAYSKALKESSAPSALKQQQRRWMKERNKCANSECVRTKYQDRIASFGKRESEAAQLAKHDKPLVFKLEDGNDRAVCRDMAENLNRVQPSLASFSTEIVFDPKMTQFSWPDWKELDIKDYLDVIYSIEKKLIHPAPYEIPPIEEWKKEYLAAIQKGMDKHVATSGKITMVWRPRLRMVRVRFESSGYLETVLGYTRNRDIGDWKKGWLTACRDVYPYKRVTAEAIRRSSECSANYEKQTGIGSLMGEVGDHIVTYEPDKRKVQFILSTGRGKGASSIGSFFLFLHNGRGYLSYPGYQIHHIEKVVPMSQSMDSWEQGEFICEVVPPYFRNQ